MSNRINAGRRLAGLSVAVAGLLLGAAGSVARGQVFYEPVQYQYGQGDGKYYYGGSDPAAFAHAERVSACGVMVGGHAYSTAVNSVPVVPRATVYADCVPFQNAADWGATATDARNEAYAAQARYFRKSDLLRAAVPAPGGLVVPAQAQPIPAAGAGGGARAVADPVQPRGTILIIPRKMLEKPKAPDGSVAVAKP